jgi:hypothetical protein
MSNCGKFGRNKPKRKALVAVSRKLLKVILRVMSDDSMFIRNYQGTKNMKKVE